jgi:hypothetical protein
MSKEVVVPIGLEELKKEIGGRRALVEEKERLSRDISDKREAFLKEVYKNAKNYENIEKVTNLLVSLVKEYEVVESQLRSLDQFIVSKMEIILGDAVFRFTYPDHYNDVGDKIPAKQYYVVPEHNPESQFIEVSANDLWFLKIMSETIGKDKMKNFQVVKKQSYNNKT